MKTLFLTAAFVAAALAPTEASAQAMPAAVIAVVDLDRVTADCTACKTASAALRSQVTSLQNREKTLSTPLQTEGKSIQAAIDALAGKEPDAALQARIQRNQQYIQKQIADKLGPIYQSVMQRRGANVLLETGSTLATTTSVDVTNDVLAALNTALPTIATVAPAQAAPQGR